MILNRCGVPENETWEHVSDTYLRRSEIRSNCISGPYRNYAHEHGTRTYDPMRVSKRARYGKKFPKRIVANNFTSTATMQQVETIWQDTPSFAWEYSEPEIAKTISNQPFGCQGKETYLPIENIQREPSASEHYFKKQEKEAWSQFIAELETFFAQCDSPTQEINLNQCTNITDCPRFIHNHLTIIKANNGKRAFLPYFDRLIELKAKLTGNSQ